MFIDAARRQGAEPVLITPMPRRRFGEDGRLQPTHGDYPAAMRDLAWQRGVKLVDLGGAAARIVEEIGPEASKTLYCHVASGHPNYPDGAQDDTHLSFDGAVTFARAFLALEQEEKPC